MLCLQPAASFSSYSLGFNKVSTSSLSGEGYFLSAIPSEKGCPTCHLCENSSRYGSLFPGRFLKKMLPLELLLKFGILRPQKGTANDKQSRSKFAAAQDCSKAVSNCWRAQHASRHEAWRLSPPDLSLHGLFPRPLHAALERRLGRYWELTSLGVGESNLTFPRTPRTVLVWRPCPPQTHRHLVSPSVPFLAATCSFLLLRKNNSHPN